MKASRVGRTLNSKLRMSFDHRDLLCSERCYQRPQQNDHTDLCQDYIFSLNKVEGHEKGDLNVFRTYQ